MKNKTKSILTLIIIYAIYLLMLSIFNIPKMDVYYLNIYFTAFSLIISIAVISFAKETENVKSFLNDKFTISAFAYYSVQIIISLIFIKNDNTKVVVPCAFQIALILVYVIALIILKRTNKSGDSDE